MISWKLSFNQLNEEYELAQKKKQALDNLLETGKISDSTHESFNNEIKVALADIEKQQNELLEKMRAKTSELDSQIKTLEMLLANYEIQHVTGELDEETYQMEITLLGRALDITKNELGNVKDAVNQLCTPLVAPPTPAVETEVPSIPEVAPEEPTENVEEMVTTAPTEIETEVSPQPTIQEPIDTPLQEEPSVYEQPEEPIAVMDQTPTQETQTPIENTPQETITYISQNPTEEPVVEAPLEEPVVEAPLEEPVAQTFESAEVVYETEPEPVIQEPVVFEAEDSIAPAVEEPVFEQESVEQISEPTIEQPQVENTENMESAPQFNEEAAVEEPTFEEQIAEPTIEPTPIEEPEMDTIEIIQADPIKLEANPINSSPAGEEVQNQHPFQDAPQVEAQEEISTVEDAPAVYAETQQDTIPSPKETLHAAVEAISDSNDENNQ